jgi:purine nucleoside phosphorylase
MVDDTAEIGIFGGTGIYDSEILQNSKEITIETPYGKTIVQIFGPSRNWALQGLFPHQQLEV